MHLTPERYRVKDDFISRVDDHVWDAERSAPIWNRIVSLRVTRIMMAVEDELKVWCVDAIPVMNLESVIKPIRKFDLRKFVSDRIIGEVYLSFSSQVTDRVHPTLLKRTDWPNLAMVLDVR